MEEISGIYDDDTCQSARSRRFSRRRQGAAPRQLNPLKQQYCNLIRLWRDEKNAHKWVGENFSNLRLPFVLDIGCGEGEWAMKVAKEHDHVNVLGLELRSAALTKERRAIAKDMPNSCLLDANILTDLKTILNDISLAGGSVASVMVQFPDPHWKKKNYKRRILGPGLLDSCFECLSSHATLFVRTDVLQVVNDFSIIASRQFLEGPPDPLVDVLCQIPTERMLYVKRKGGVTYAKTFRARAVVVEESEEDEADDLESSEPLFGYL